MPELVGQDGKDVIREDKPNSLIKKVVLDELSR